MDPSQAPHPAYPGLVNTNSAEADAPVAGPSRLHTAHSRQPSSQAGHFENGSDMHRPSTADTDAEADEDGPHQPHTRRDSYNSSSNNQSRRKRARIGTKITRNRKITSCLPCRERKQKCDRTHPKCNKCIEDGRQCYYVDNDNAPGDRDDKRDKPSEEEEDDQPADGPPGMSPKSNKQAEFIKKRRHLIAATWTAGRNRTLDFETRVRAARAAAVAEVLFAENGASDLKAKGRLKLPTRSEAQDLLQYYEDDVQGFSNILLIDLNRARFGDFLDWWHSNPITLPAEADAPLAPLVLCVLALALQAKRTRDAIAKAESGDKGHVPQDGHCLSVIPSVSPERFLLETAGRCINALQIACPSSWASAYSAPLDIVRAETLRGIWHLGECHLQFASSTFNVALRLATAAGLHRDPKHWGSLEMSEFEAQARRGAWWNIAYVEVFHAHRTGQPSSISPDAADTELPLAFSAIAAQFKAAGFPQGSLSQLSFDCFVARFYLTKLFLEQSASVFGLRRRPAQVVRDLEAIYDKWERSLPEHLSSRMDNLSQMLLASPDASSEQHREPLWQLLILQIGKLQGRISVHRPYSDMSSGIALNADAARQSLEKCLDAASQLIALCLRALRRRPGPPFLWLNIISYHTFNAGCLVAIHLVSGSNVAALCSTAYREALEVLDDLAAKRGLHNVSEQAERYAAAIREIAAMPNRFNKNGDARDSPAVRSSEGHRNSGQSGEAGPSASTTVHRASHPHTSLPLRVGRTSPVNGLAPLPDGASASASAQLADGDHAQRRTWSPVARNADAEAFSPRHPARAASPRRNSNLITPPFAVIPADGTSSDGALIGVPGAAPLAMDPPTAGSSSDASAEDFFTKQRAVTSLADRPLPGANQLHFGSLGSFNTNPEDLLNLALISPDDGRTHLQHLHSGSGHAESFRGPLGPQFGEWPQRMHGPQHHEPWYGDGMHPINRPPSMTPPPNLTQQHGDFAPRSASKDPMQFPSVLRPPSAEAVGGRERLPSIQRYMHPGSSAEPYGRPDAHHSSSLPPMMSNAPSFAHHHTSQRYEQLHGHVPLQHAGYPSPHHYQHRSSAGPPGLPSAYPGGGHLPMDGMASHPHMVAGASGGGGAPPMPGGPPPPPVGAPGPGAHASLAGAGVDNLGQVDWFAWDNFITKVLQSG